MSFVLQKRTYQCSYAGVIGLFAQATLLGEAVSDIRQIPAPAEEESEVSCGLMLHTMGFRVVVEPFSAAEVASHKNGIRLLRCQACFVSGNLELSDGFYASSLGYLRR